MTTRAWKASPFTRVFALGMLALPALGGCSDRDHLSSVPDPGTAAAALIAGQGIGPGQIIPDEYIIVFHPGTADVPGLARALAARHKGEIRHVYEHAIQGFAARFPAQAVEALQKNPHIAYIEPDQEVWTVGSPSSPQSGATWGLDRIDQRALPLDNLYHFEQTGAGVTVYIFDTGIHYSHEEFGGRAVFGFDSGRRRPADGRDWDGHGTHVSGTVGGSTYGVAKDVTLVSVRVLGDQNPGGFSNVIAGIDWLMENAQFPAVANLSLGGGASDAVDDAVRSSIATGVTYVVAAVNQGADACSYSPARVREALTVGATTNTDERRSSSNWGECVDLFAPGDSITSSLHTSNTATGVSSGTSMASPHVAGVAALYLELYPDATPAQVFTAITGATTKDIVTNSPPGNNHLLFSLAWGEVTPPVQYTITATAGEGGTIEPLGEVVVNEGASQAFSIAANEGFQISDVEVDGFSVGAAASYTFTNVTANHTIHATFEAATSEPPSIDQFDLTNTSNPQFARVRVDWAVSGQDLATVTVAITGPNSDSQTWNVSGSSAFGQHEFSFRRGFGDYTVTLTATDAIGQISETKEITL